MAAKTPKDAAAAVTQMLVVGTVGVEAIRVREAPGVSAASGEHQGDSGAFGDGRPQWSVSPAQSLHCLQQIICLALVLNVFLSPL